MFTVKIPATTANMGPGFDSIGLALALYNYVEIHEGTENGRMLDIRQRPPNPARKTLDWYNEPIPEVPNDENNLIYKSILQFFSETGQKPPPLTITQENHIPMTGGLGSSAACVAAGLLIANHLMGDKLTREELTDRAARLEGHPDNTTPALAGGLTVGVMTDKGLVYSHLRGAWEKRLRFALFIPAFTLPTEKARSVLPESYSRGDAVFNASRAALMATAMTSGDFAHLSAAMEDRLHQPYRLKLMPGMAEIKAEAIKCGAYNLFLSGAGSALIAVTEEPLFVERIRPFVKALPQRWNVGWVQPDMQGAVIME